MIREHVARQSAAPYFMAQAAIVQENAIEQLDVRIKEQAAEIEALKRAQNASHQNSGGFLAGLVGSRSQPQSVESRSASSLAGNTGAQSSLASGRFGQQPGAGQQLEFVQRGASAQGGGFLSGALQTAAGVAGGMVLGNMLMGMFQDDGVDQLSSQAPAEEPPVAQDEPAADDYYADEGFFGDGEDDEFV
ncbi:DUF2076 domain-containing protein [Pseudomonas auratipiscis]|uniref:DUF2076 family protein n=1 Tax=Pseudomonas auratipiscis TaxID=3115853 RepID=A0AB35WQM1_9PSED|nr:MULTISPECIES: DUF2076 family protein [unclassified Pseudomonas]MEE1866995.1 DUF2076 family protein [Pseudomonas sp. 120P]MEE1957822.1 DUF2076 family protein [Pseudomonas sp. 119P]